MVKIPTWTVHFIVFILLIVVLVIRNRLAWHGWSFWLVLGILIAVFLVLGLMRFRYGD